jgi:hypothetical protein
MNFPKGTVLLDNTTLFGAVKAFEAWPPKPQDWLSGPHAVNLRALIDVLEAIVLYESIIVDKSSREETGPFVIWDELERLEDVVNTPKGYAYRPIVNQLNFADDMHIGPLLNMSLDKLGQYISNGTFLRGVERFQKDDMAFVVPQFYYNAGNFGTLVKRSFIRSNNSFFRAEESFNDSKKKLKTIEALLKDSEQAVQNYAMFAFRGFFYQQLAHLYSLSYSPHTWRSEIVDIDTSTTTLSFADYIDGITAQVRQDLAARLDNRFQPIAYVGDFPAIASYIASEVTERNQLLPAALEVRRSSAARAFRYWLRTLESNALNQAELAKAVKAQEEVEKIVHDLRKQFGLIQGTKPEGLKIKLGIPMIQAEIPTSLSAQMPSWLEKIIHRRQHLVFLRDVTEKSARLSPFALRYQGLPA